MVPYTGLELCQLKIRGCHGCDRTGLELCPLKIRGWHGYDRRVVEFITTYMQSMPITTKVVSLNHAPGELYSIQLYVSVT